MLTVQALHDLSSCGPGDEDGGIKVTISTEGEGWRLHEASFAAEVPPPLPRVVSPRPASQASPPPALPNPSSESSPLSSEVPLRTLPTLMPTSRSVLISLSMSSATGLLLLS